MPISVGGQHAEVRKIGLGFAVQPILLRTSPICSSMIGHRGCEPNLLGFGRRAGREVWCQARDNKLLEDIGDRGLPNSDQCRREH